MFRKIDSNQDGQFTYDDFVRSAGDKKQIDTPAINLLAARTTRADDTVSFREQRSVPPSDRHSMTEASDTKSVYRTTGKERKMEQELERRRTYLDKLKSLALFAKNQQDRVLDIQNTTASMAQQDFKIRRLKRDFPKIISRLKRPGNSNEGSVDQSRRALGGRGSSEANISNRYGQSSRMQASHSTEKFSELNKFLDEGHRTNINQEGFFGKLNKYQYSDLKKLREEPNNQQQFGKPTANNNASIKQLVSNYYQKEFI